GQHRSAARGAHVDREQGLLRAPALQRHGDAVQHQAAAVPHEPRGGTGPGAAGGPVGDRGPGGARGSAGRPVEQRASPLEPRTAPRRDRTGVTTLNLFQQQEANRRRTFWLVVGFVVFFAWLGFGGDYIYYLYTRDAPRLAYHHTFPWFGLVLSLAALAIAWYAYKTGPEKVLWSTGAREVTDPQDPREKQLVNVVEEMAIAAGIPRPRIWIVDDPDPNAFATGTDPLHSHLAVTQGLLDICTRDELQGVIGHKLELGSALRQIEGAQAPPPHIKRGAAHLCIADPLGRRLTAHEGFLADVLASHPPMGKRIAILKGMGYAQLKREGGAVG